MRFRDTIRWLPAMLALSAVMASGAEARRLAQNAVMYDVTGGARGALVSSSGSGVVVIELDGGAGKRRTGPGAPFKPKGDPKSVLCSAISNEFKVESQARLEEDLFRR